MAVGLLRDSKSNQFTFKERNQIAASRIHSCLTLAKAILHVDNLSSDQCTYLER